MSYFYGTKGDVAEYVNARLLTLRNDSQLTMTITQGLYADCSVSCATIKSLEDIGEELVASNFFSTQVNI